MLVGANAGWSNDRPLRYAETDAERMREVLVELGGFAPDRVVVLKEPDTATVREQLEKLTQTLRALGRQSLVVFYYSGHADEKQLHLRGAAPLTHREVYELLEGLPATVKVGVMDACRSGSILGVKGGRPVKAFEVKVVDELEVRGLVVLTSSGADELSQETKALAGSVFTHHLVSGMRGGADGDGSGEVTLTEAWEYAWQRTEADTAASAAPHRPAYLFEMKGEKELVLTRLRRAGARLVLPEAEGEKYVVVDEHEVRLVAEGRTQPGQRVVLALAPGAYRVKRMKAGGTKLETARVRVERGQQVEARGLEYGEQGLEVGWLKGEPERMEEGERREWKKGEASRLLAAGEAGLARELFEELLEQSPGDVGAQRGRARSLLRLAEAYDRVGDQQKVREMLREAMVADLSLTEDPDFMGWGSRLPELSASQPPIQPLPGASGGLRFGLGFDVIGPRGHGVLVGSIFFSEHWGLHLGVDLRGPGVDLGARFQLPVRGPVGSWAFPGGVVRWMPFIGLGRHLSFVELGLPSRDDEPVGGGLSYQQLYGRTVHLDTGVQLVHEMGLLLELGAGVIASSQPFTSSWRLVPVVSAGAGWRFH